MTLRLDVDTAAWRTHVETTVAALGHDPADGAVAPIVPVVKGNGYGFGRDRLAAEAVSFAGSIAVGTVWELHDVTDHAFDAVVVLTPVLDGIDELLRHDHVAVPTIGRREHLDALVAGGWRGRVCVKLASSMRRYGIGPQDAASLVHAVHGAGLELHTAMLHPPLAGDHQSHLAELDGWIGRLPAALPVTVSHLSPGAFLAVRARHPDRHLSLRLGTALWHGDKSMLQLSADVVDTRPVRHGDVAGYRGLAVPGDGTLVMVGAGSSHGVAALDDGRSPFHHARRRVPLHEAPHMHTSMLFVASSDPCPAIGDWVDVQRPLITSSPDVVRWR
jgi:alanine racemase